MTHGRIVASLIFLAIAAPCAASAQSSYFAGFMASAGDLQSPYGGSCAADHGVAGGVGVYAGRVAGVLELTAAYKHVTSIGSPSCVLAPRVMPDGVHTLRHYSREVASGADLVTVRAGYSPPFLSLLSLHAGGGVEAQAGDPLVLVGGSVRTRGRVRLRVGIELAYLRASYTDFAEDWQDLRRVGVQELDAGGSWRRSLAFWIGGEVPLSVLSQN